MTLAKTIVADAKRVLSKSPTVTRVWWLYLRDPGFKAVVRHRIARVLYVRGFVRISWLLFARTHAATGAELPPTAEIGPGLRIPHPAAIVVGNRAVMGSNCTLLQGVTLGERLGKGGPHDYPTLSDSVTVGAGAKILGGICVHEGAMIGANSVVLSDVPPHATVVGAPARVVTVKSGVTTQDMAFFNH
jgi:serine O-acetyltransferase